MKGNEQFIEPACHQVGADAIHITLRQSSLYTYFAASAWMATVASAPLQSQIRLSIRTIQKVENFCDVCVQSSGVTSLNVVGF